MKSWARITRTLLSMFFRTGKGEKKRRVSAVVVVLLGLLFAVMIGAAFAFLSPVLAQAGLLAVAATLPMETAFVAVLVFGTMGVFSYIYYSRDNEFLLSLPVSPSTVYVEPPSCAVANATYSNSVLSAIRRRKAPR